MNQKERYYPLPRLLEKFLKSNGYEEIEPGRFELKGPARALFQDCSMIVEGKETEVYFTATHAPQLYREPKEDGRIITWMPQKRVIRYAIKREVFTEQLWKLQFSDALQNMALSLFLPFFNLHTTDQNGHLQMKP